MLGACSLTAPEDIAPQGSRPAPPPPPLGAAAPRSVVLFVGDGMGPEHLRVAEEYRGRTVRDLFDYETTMGTDNADGGVTDSAASATAMATGVAVRNGVIAQERPGDGDDLATIADSYVASGRAFGIVTTAETTHATPAAFAAHTSSRNFRSQIARDYLEESRPDLLMGGGGAGLDADAARSAAYAVYDSLSSFVAASAGGADDDVPAAVLIGEGHLPYVVDEARESLADMVAAALDALGADPDGVFLLVEAARIDHASHDNDLERTIGETVELLDAVDELLDRFRRAGRDDVLVVLTADHETGGLSVSGQVSRGVVPAEPDVSWSTGGHTSTRVPVLAWGDGADRVESVDHVTDIYRLLRGVPLE